MTCHIIISGFVQGVGYRQFVKKTALSLDLKGWVKNLPRRQAGIDGGRVETLFSGSKEAIEKAIKACRKGPFLAEVKDIRIEWKEPFDFAQGKKEPDFQSFEIII